MLPFLLVQLHRAYRNPFERLAVEHFLLLSWVTRTSIDRIMCFRMEATRWLSLPLSVEKGCDLNQGRLPSPTCVRCGSRKRPITLEGVMMLG